MNKFARGVKTPLMLTLVLLLICGILYPLLLTGVSQLMFSDKAKGSLIVVGDRVMGSSLIGQYFTDIRFMQGRPSAIKYNTFTLEDKENGDYSGVKSGSDNYSPSNPKLKERVEKNMSEFLKRNPNVGKRDIPTDMLTASGSGLDPHISPQSAYIQIEALSRATGLSKERLEEIVNINTDKKIMAILGEDTVNVLKVNLQIAKDLKLI